MELRLYMIIIKNRNSGPQPIWYFFRNKAKLTTLLLKQSLSRYSVMNYSKKVTQWESNNMLTTFILMFILCWGYPFNDGLSEVLPRSQGNNFLKNMLNGSLNHIVICTSNTLYTTYQGRIPSIMCPLIYKNIILFHL